MTKLDELVEEWGSEDATGESLTRMSMEDQEIDEDLLAKLNEAEPGTVLKTLIRHFARYRDADEHLEIAMIGLDEYALAVISGSTPSRLIKSMAMAIAGMATPDGVDPFDFGMQVASAWFTVLKALVQAHDE